MRENYNRLLTIRAGNIAAHYGMKLEISSGSRMYGISWKAEFTRLGMRWEFHEASPKELFYVVAAFGDGLRAAERLVEVGEPLVRGKGEEKGEEKGE